MAAKEESDTEFDNTQENRSLSELEEDFDHTIGLSPRSSTGSHVNLCELNDMPITSTPENQGHFKDHSHCMKGRSHKDPGDTADKMSTRPPPSEDNPCVTVVKGSLSKELASKGILKVDTSHARSNGYKPRRRDRQSVKGRKHCDEWDGDDEYDGEDPDDDVAMASQLSQLQEIVGEMKSGFVTAMKALSDIQYGDQKLQQTVDSNKEEYEKQLADVLQMVLSLKSEFAGVLSDLHAATDSQRALRHQVECLQYERDILLEELEKAGAISKQLREKYHSGRERPQGLYHNQSSSNLSGLLERARLSFQANHGGGGGTGSQNSSRVTSDSGVTSGQAADLCDDVTSPPPALSPMMQSYIAALPQQQNLAAEPTQVDSQDESDSSITAAANKSLDLSRSLGDACGQELGLDLSDTEKDNEAETAKDDGELSSGSSSPGEIPERQKAQSASFKRPLTPPNRLAPHERNAKEVLRGRVARELVDTERKYCSSLWTLLDHFAARLRDSAMASNKDISQMFPPCLSRIYEHHCAFLQKLEDRLDNGKWQCVIGDVVSRFIESSEYDLLAQYQNYMNEFPSALHTIRKTCRNSSKFRKFLREAQHHPSCAGLDVGAFMLTPVQRVPRYVLLLKQLLKQTDSEHPDHYFLSSSLQRLGNFLNQLNDSIESSMKLVHEDDAPKLRKKSRFPSFRRSNTADVLDTSGLDSSLDGSALVNSLGGRFVVSSPKHVRPLSVHGYPGVVLASAQSLQAIPVAVARNDAVLTPDTAYLVQDSTGRLIPVKQKKVKRASKSDLKQGLCLSSSFHGAMRPRLAAADSPCASPRSLRGYQQRPHSICMDSLADEQGPHHGINTSTPSSVHGKRYMQHTGYQSDVTGTPQLDRTVTLQSEGGMMPPPPFPISPRSRGSHMHTNGSLSYHQNLRRVLNEYGHHGNDSESDTDLLPPYPGNFGNSVSASTQHSNQYTVNTSSQHAASSHDSRIDHNGAYSKLRSQSVIEFRETAKPLTSQSAVDFRNASDVDSVTQQHINAALAQSLTIRADSSSPHLSNPSPVSTRSTSSNSHPLQNSRPLPRECSYEYRPKMGNIDRPVSKLTSKRHSLKRFESPTPSLRTTSSLVGCEAWHQGTERERWSNASTVSCNPDREWQSRDGAETSVTGTSTMDTSVFGSKRKDSKKQQKEREKRLAAQSMGDLGKKQKPSLRQSLKNIFFRKNEETEGKQLQQPIVEEESSKMCSSTGNLLDHSQRSSVTSLQASPARESGHHGDDDSLVIANHNGLHLTLSHDDNDPCSAV